MAKNITSVSWEASNLPSGLSFDTATGTFSGTPSVEGEFTVPVSVKTNYGEDSKDVTIKAVKAYPVYAIGDMAATWSTLDDQVDEYGFYPLSMPNTKKLFPHFGGFYALSKDNNLYRIGVSDLTTAHRDSYPYSYNSDILPKKVGAYSIYKYLLGQVHYQITVDITDGNYFYEIFDILVSKTNTQNNTIRVETGGRYVLTTSGNVNNYTTINTRISVPNNTLLAACDIGETSEILRKSSYRVGGSKKEAAETIYYLSEDGTKIQKIRFTYGGNNTDIKVTSSVSNLGYCAKKMFFSSVFSFLSEDNYIDNNPDIFGYGEIKNVYAMGSTAYIQTDNNEFYFYDTTNSNWIKLGDFSVKKVEISSSGNITFMLTNDGKLYHKGNSVTNITEEHADLTQIFRDCYFNDFTFSRNTLTVLKE